MQGDQPGGGPAFVSCLPSKKEPQGPAGRI